MQLVAIVSESIEENEIEIIFTQCYLPKSNPKNI